MSRLFLLMLVFLFAYMMWRMIKIMTRMGGSNRRSIYDQPKPQEPVQKFKDVKDAEFEEIKKPAPGDTSLPGS